MAEGVKQFVNDTGKDITLTIFVRDGDSPRDEGANEAYDLSATGPDREIHVVYEGDPGSDGYVYLNALLVEWTEGGNMIGVSRRVVERGDAWDDTLNTNSIITLNAAIAGQLTASGSN